MSHLAEHAFRQAVRTGLAHLDAPIEVALTSLVRHPFPQEVYALAFEVFSDGFTSGFPVRVFFLDRSNSEHFIWEGERAEYPSPVDPGLLDIDHVYPDRLEEALEVAAPDADPWDIASEELIAWFAAHWLRVGGAGFSRMATIALHDAGQEFNLKSGCWQARYSFFEQIC
jgi:hypothetical protein